MIPGRLSSIPPCNQPEPGQASADPNPAPQDPVQAYVDPNQLQHDPAQAFVDPGSAYDPNAGVLGPPPVGSEPTGSSSWSSGAGNSLSTKKDGYQWPWTEKTTINQTCR